MSTSTLADDIVDVWRQPAGRATLPPRPAQQVEDAAVDDIPDSPFMVLATTAGCSITQLVNRKISTVLTFHLPPDDPGVMIVVDALNAVYNSSYAEGWDDGFDDGAKHGERSNAKTGLGDVVWAGGDSIWLNKEEWLLVRKTADEAE